MVMKRPAASIVEEAPEAEAVVEAPEAEEAPAAVLKRPAAKKAREETAAAEVAEKERVVAEEAPKPSDDASEEKPAPAPAPVREEVSQEELLRRQEAETTAARRKELKATAIDALKQLVGDQGLEVGRKEDMVQRLVEHEAAGRAELRAAAARTRKVLVDKKEALEALSLPELKERCAEEGVKGGQLTKPARVEALIKLWMEDDGVNKALTKMAHDAREAVLTAMEPQALKKLCDTASVDPFVTEVMVDRILKCEHAVGRFGRPTLERETKEVPLAPAAAAGVDMVDALLAEEAARKRERELKKQEEEAAAKQRSDLKSKSLDELKKQLASKGRDASGKKDDLVEALLRAGVEEEAAAKRRLEVKAMEAVELRRLLQSKALPVSGKKDEMVDTFLAFEASVVKNAIAYSAKVDAAFGEMEAELEEQTLAALKELCASKGLKGGVNKEACLERLSEDLKTSGGGEIDRVLATRARAARREELSATPKETLLSLCSSFGICPLVKEVMVERILSHEAESGSSVQEPATKKARTKK